MRRKHSRTAATVAALLAGGLAAFALRPTDATTTATLAARNPAVEVRTQVIRRTIHVIRHEPGAVLRGARGSSSVIVRGHGRVTTAPSGTHHSTSASSPGSVATRVSGSHRGSVSPASGSGTAVSTRASGSHGSSPAPASHPVSTRASGSHGSSPSGASGRPVTRSSGSSHHGGDDGGDGQGSGGDN